MTPATRFSLLRHGQTVWNVEKRLQGQEDSPLTAVGKRLVATWAGELERYDFSHILASDLGRVRQTVAILNQRLGLQVTFGAGLREQSWGRWEGLTLTELQARDGESLRYAISQGWEFAAPGGDRRSEVRQRAMATLESFAASHPGANVLVVCHLGVIKAIIYGIAGRRYLPGEPKLLEKSMMHEIMKDHSGFTISRLNIPVEPKSP